MALGTAVAPAAPRDQPAVGWPQLQHDAEHTGYTPEALHATHGMRTAWVTDFRALGPQQHIAPNVQVVVAEQRLFVPTMEGQLFALDPRTGEILWHAECGGAVLHTAGVEQGRVFVATIGGDVLCLNAASGKELWRWNSGKRAGFSAAVLLAEDKVFVGSRQGDVHAIAQADGKPVWSYAVGAPIFQTPAWNAGRVYVAAEDMHCYALSATHGKLLWKSRKLGGVSFRDYHPLVHDGVVLVEAMQAGGGYSSPSKPMAPSWNVTAEETKWARQHLPVLASGQVPESTLREIIGPQDRQVEELKRDPGRMTRFALDATTGEERILPNWYKGGMLGPRQPGMVDRDGRVLVDASCLVFGCGYGRLDLKRERVVDLLLDRDYDYFQPGSHAPGVGNPDETMLFSAAGPLIFAVHPGHPFGIFSGPCAHYVGYYDLDRRRWTPFTEEMHQWMDTNRRSPNAQCGGSAPSIAYGAVYRQALDYVFCHVPKE